MANFFTLTLDTLGPQSPSLVISGGASYTTQQLVNLTIGCADGVTTGYQMLIWGDVDSSYDTNINTAQGTSTWITYTTTKQIKLSTGDGEKNIYLILRDDVRNTSSQVTAAINLDTAIPTVTINGPDVNKVSKIAARNVATFSFTCDSAFVEYKVKVVAASGAVENTGTVIPVAGGSVNMSATGAFPANTPINCQITGQDLETASSGDGTKTIKVFVKDVAGLWSA